jgi:hypothetical protein
MIVKFQCFLEVSVLAEYFVKMELLSKEYPYLQGDKCAIFVVIVLELIFCVESRNLVSLMAGTKIHQRLCLGKTGSFEC